MPVPSLLVGCAGWSLPRAVQPAFGEGASLLARYATRFPVAEINSSFHRPHAFNTYARWAAAVPAHFRFSVKLPRTISHDKRLVDCAEELAEFLLQSAGLGDRLGCLLVQLPPSFAFASSVAAPFFTLLRQRHPGGVAVEPRHVSWFTREADALLAGLAMARVLADPVRHEPGRWPGGDLRRIYLRLHGSPRMYYSAYQPEVLIALARRMREAAADGAEVWCIFDNTAGQAAAGDALALCAELERTA
jgi:uncharacterized protein YecE (DUF72 family)